MRKVKIRLRKDRAASEIAASEIDLRRDGRSAVDGRCLRLARSDGLKGRQFGRIGLAAHPVEDVRAVDIEDVRPVGLQTTVILLASGGKSDERQIERAADAGRKTTVDEMRLVRAGESRIVAEQTAESVIGVEIPVVRQTFFEHEFQSVIAALRPCRLGISESLERFQMKAAARIADNVSLAARRIDDARVLDRLVDILIGIANAEDVVLAHLPFDADRELGLLKRFQIRIDRAAVQGIGVRVVGVDAQILLAAAAGAGDDESRLRADARSGVTADDIVDIKAAGRIAGEKLEVIFEKNVAAEQAARQLEFDAVEKLAVAGEDLRLAVAVEIVGKPEARGDLIRPVEVDRARKLVIRRQIFFFDAHAEIQSQTVERLPFVLDENALTQVGAFAVGAGPSKRSRADRAGSIGHRAAEQSRDRRTVVVGDAADGVIARLDVVENGVALVAALQFVSAARFEDVGGGKFIRLPNRNVFERNSVGAGRGAWESRIGRSAAKDLDGLRDKIIAQLFVEKTAAETPVDDQIARRSIDARDGHHVRVLASALLIGKIVSGQNADAGAEVGGRHIAESDRRGSDVGKRRGRNDSLVADRVPEKRARQSQLVERAGIETGESVIVSSLPAVSFGGDKSSGGRRLVGEILRIDVSIEDLRRIAAIKPEPVFDEAAAQIGGREIVGAARFGGVEILGRLDKIIARHRAGREPGQQRALAADQLRRF